MKRILLIAAAGFFMFNHAKAQSKGRESKLGLGLEVAIPVGAYQDVADYGLGFSALYQKPVTESLSITGNVGYLRFHGPAVFNNIKYKEGYVPVKAGARYFILPGVYGAGELGVSISTANGYGSGTAFIYAPALGTMFKVGSSGTLDLGIRYENWARSNATRSFAGIRAGYNF